MRLAEALSLRKALESRVGQLTDLLVKTSWRYEGMEAEGARSYGEVEQELLETLGELEGLIIRINRTNVATALDFEGERLSIMEAIAQRDIIGRKIGALRQSMQAMISALQPDARRTYLFEREDAPRRVRTAVPVKDLEQRVNQLAARHRALDVAIQAKGWQTDLVS